MEGPLGGNCGHWLTAWRTGQSDPLLTFKVGPLNGRKRQKAIFDEGGGCADASFSGGDRAQNRPVCGRAPDVAAFLRTGAVSLSIIVSGERLSQAANCLQLLVLTIVMLLGGAVVWPIAHLRSI
jgi:hypothetical protein